MSSKRNNSENEEDFDEDSGDGYAVERIVNKKVINDKVQYLVKWVGYNKPTWEPEENLECPDLVAEYEQGLNKKSEGKKKSSYSGGNSEASSKKKRKKEESSDLDGLEPDKILGATNDSEIGLMFLVKWKERDEADLVSSKVCNEKYPQTVIAFYEERLSWDNDNQEEEEKHIAQTS